MGIAGAVSQCQEVSLSLVQEEKSSPVVRSWVRAMSSKVMFSIR